MRPDPGVEAVICRALAANPRCSSAAIAREAARELGLPASRLRALRRLVAKVAAQAGKAGTRLDGEVEDGMRGTTQKLVGGPAGLVGVDITCVTVHGSVIRGTLRAASPTWLEIEKTSGRAALVRLDAVATVTDETPPLLRAVGRREAEAHADVEGGR